MTVVVLCGSWTATSTALSAGRLKIAARTGIPSARFGSSIRLPSISARDVTMAGVSSVESFALPHAESGRMRQREGRS